MLIFKNYKGQIVGEGGNLTIKQIVKHKKVAKRGNNIPT